MEDVLDPPVNKDPDQDKLIQDQSTPCQTNPKDLDTLVVSRHERVNISFLPCDWSDFILAKLSLVDDNDNFLCS